jgi:hypothetical protein
METFSHVRAFAFISRFYYLSPSQRRHSSTLNGWPRKAFRYS